MADSSNSTSAPCAIPPDFYPAAWLDQFEQVGGWWVIGADGKISAGWMLENFTDEQSMAARRQLADLNQRPDKCAAVGAEILARSAREVSHGHA